MKKVFLFSLLIACSLISFNVCAGEKDPVVVWDKTYDSGYADEMYAIAVDSSGNVYTTGYSHNATGNDDYRTIKFNSVGDTVYNKFFNGTANRNDIAQGIAVDAQGNAIVVGTSQNAIDDDMMIRKYDRNGVDPWYKIYNSGDNDEAYGVALDTSNNIYVVGVIKNATNDIHILKYDSSGDTILNVVYDSGFADLGCGIAVDSSRNIYVAGASHNGTDYDVKVIKFNSSGDTVWVKAFDSGTGQSDIATAIAVDSKGNIYVAGVSNNNFAVFKYSANGSFVWEDLFDGGSDDWANGIAIDSSDNIYVAGYTNNGTNYDMKIIKYDSLKNRLWEIIYDSGSNDQANGIALDNSGNFYIAGKMQNDARIIKYKLQYSDVVPPATAGEVKIGSSNGDGIAHSGENVIIRFKPTEAGKITAKIYTLSGMFVKELPAYDSSGPNDYNNVMTWECNNEDSAKVASGIYVLNIQGPGINLIKKIAIVR